MANAQQIDSAEMAKLVSELQKLRAEVVDREVQLTQQAITIAQLRHEIREIKMARDLYRRGLERRQNANPIRPN